MLPASVSAPRPVLVNPPAPLSTPLSERSAAVSTVSPAPSVRLLVNANAIALLKVELPITDRLPVPNAVLLPSASVPAFNTVPPV